MSDEIVVLAMGGTVLGLDATSGARRWRYDFPDPPKIGLLVRLAVAGDILYALVPKRLACIHVPTGRVIGVVDTIDAFGYSGGTLLATPERIVVAISNGVQCFSNDGRLLWQDNLKGETKACVAIAMGDRVAQADETS